MRAPLQLSAFHVWKREGLGSWVHATRKIWATVPSQTLTAVPTQNAVSRVAAAPLKTRSLKTHLPIQCPVTVDARSRLRDASFALTWMVLRHIQNRITTSKKLLSGKTAQMFGPIQASRAHRALTATFIPSRVCFKDSPSATARRSMQIAGKRRLASATARSRRKALCVARTCCDSSSQSCEIVESTADGWSLDCFTSTEVENLRALIPQTCATQRPCLLSLWLLLSCWSTNVRVLTNKLS